MTRIDARAHAPQGIEGVTADAASPDGLVGVTVGAYGDLRELRLDPRHQRTRDAAALAATIMSTVHAAADVAARAAYESVASQLPPGTAPEEADLLFGPLLHNIDLRIGRG